LNRQRQVSRGVFIDDPLPGSDVGEGAAKRHPDRRLPGGDGHPLAEAQLGIKKGNDYVAFHSAVPAESNQWYQFQIVDRSGYMLAGEALIDTLKNRGDPRLAQYYAKNGSGQYVRSKPGENNDAGRSLAGGVVGSRVGIVRTVCSFPASQCRP